MLQSILKKIQGLPLSQKRIIFWALLVISGVVFLWLWLISTEHRLSQINTKQINSDLHLPEIKNEIFEEPPQLKLPDLNQDLKQLEKALEEGVKGEAKNE